LEEDFQKSVRECKVEQSQLEIVKKKIQDAENEFKFTKSLMEKRNPRLSYQLEKIEESQVQAQKEMFAGAPQGFVGQMN